MYSANNVTKPCSLSRRLEGVSESATLKLNATVQAMKAKGVPVVNLTAGEPNFNVPEEAKQAVIEALRTNQSKYTPVAGILELREAVAARTNSQHAALAKGQPWKASDVIVSNGAKHSIFNALMAVVNPGDEVLIPSPYWVSYPEMVKIAGGVPRFIPTTFENDFKVRPDQIRAALSPKTKAILLNSPNNPTGMMYSQEEFARIAEALDSSPEGRQVWVISDEIYDRIVFGEVPFCSFLTAAPHFRDRTVTVNGMSKSASMTGWRVGWSVASAEVTQAMATLQGQATSGINSLAQWASLAALKLPESYFQPQVQQYRDRRDLLLRGLKKSNKLTFRSPTGAFYVFVGVEKCLRSGEDSMGFAQRLLEEAQVAVVPGTPFGDSHYIRLSFATDDASIQEGCDRILKYI